MEELYQVALGNYSHNSQPPTSGSPQPLRLSHKRLVRPRHRGQGPGGHTCNCGVFSSGHYTIVVVECSQLNTSPYCWHRCRVSASFMSPAAVIERREHLRNTPPSYGLVLSYQTIPREECHQDTLLSYISGTMPSSPGFLLFSLAIGVALG